MRRKRRQAIWLCVAKMLKPARNVNGVYKYTANAEENIMSLAVYSEVTGENSGGSLAAAILRENINQCGRG
jgi:hypothetical protein